MQRCWIHALATMLALGVGAIGMTNSTATAQTPFKVGEPFPEVYFPSVADGEPMSVRDFRGQKVMLHVFASW